MSVPAPVPDHVPAVDPAKSKWFAEKVQPHEPALRAYLRNRFPSMRDVDDVVQDSYVQMLKQPPTDKIRSVRAYLFTVAHHAVLKVFRKRKIYSDTPVNELPEWRLMDGGEDAADTAHARSQEALVAEAIAELPGRCREIFKRRVAGGLSYAEIAAELGLSEATVRVQIARGLQKCAQFLRERGVNNPP